MSLILIPKENNDELKVDFKDVNVSILNAIRRICLSEYYTIGFNIDDYINSDIKVIENTSGLHNEFLLHRIGLIPIHYDDIDTFDSNKYKFILNVQNKTNQIMNVTTEYFKVFDTYSEVYVDPEKFFPPSKFNTHILINKLKPNPNGIGEKIHIEGKSSRNNGKTHARFQPTSCITYNNKRDPQLVSTELSKYISQGVDKSTEVLEKEFEQSIADRCFYKNIDGLCNYFEMYIESIGIVLPEKILYGCLDILSKKIIRFKSNITKIISEDITEYENVSILKSTEHKDAFSIIVTNESHTLGNIIQAHMIKLFNKDKVTFIGYKNPHPLKDEIHFKIITTNHTLSETNEVLSHTCDYIETILEELKIPIRHILSANQSI